MPEDKNPSQFLENQNSPSQPINEFPVTDTTSPVTPTQSQPVVAPHDSVDFSPAPSSGINHAATNPELLKLEAEPTTSQLGINTAEPTIPSDSTIAEPSPALAAFGNTQLPKKRSKKPLIIALVSLVVVGLLTGSGAAAYTMWYQKPEKVLADAVVKLIQARAVTYKGDLLYQSKENNTKLEIRFDGKADRANNTETIDIKLTMEKKTYPLKASFLQTENSVFYFKIDNLKAAIESTQDAGMTLPAAATKLINAIDGRWVKITLDDIRKWGQEMADTQKCTGEVFRSMKTNDAAYKQVAEVYAKHPFVTSKGAVETKDGNLNFDIDVSEPVLKKFVTDLNSTDIQKKLQQCDKDTYTLDPDDYEVEKDEKGETSNVRVSISQWSHEFREISSTFKDETSSGSFNLKPQFLSSIDIDEPKDAMTMKELQALIDELQSEVTKSLEQEQPPADTQSV